MRLVIVEDEPIARNGLCALLSADPSVEIAGSFASASTARHGIRSVSPDCMFVDVEMPGENGLELVRSIPAASRPLVVFVTAHEDYAATAFDVDAIDYLLKPVEEQRLARAVERVRLAMATNAQARAHERLDDIFAESQSDSKPSLTRISARVGDRLVVMKLADVSWIAADGDYMRVHSDGRTLLVRMTMRDIEQRLDPAFFVRAHKSAVVNVDFVTSVDVVSHGEFVAILRDGARVRVGRSYRPALFEALGERGA